MLLAGGGGHVTVDLLEAVRVGVHALLVAVAVRAAAAAGRWPGREKLAANETVDLAVQQNERGLMQVGRYPVPGTAERIADGRTDHRVQVDLGGQRDGLENDVVVETHAAERQETPMKVAQWLHVVDACEQQQQQQLNDNGSGFKLSLHSPAAYLQVA